jgi:hypothetical protein
VVEKSSLTPRPTFNTDGLGWALNGDSVNGGPSIVNNVFTPTDGSGGENRSAWFRYQLYVGAFQASFVYQDVSQDGADGVAFVVQNEASGTTALGINGGGLGYCEISNSVAVLLNLYAGSPGGASGIMLGTNGVGAYGLTGELSGRSYQSTAPVNLDGGDPIDVNLLYVGGVLQVTLVDTLSSARFETTFPFAISNFVGGDVAWVGLTGSEGGVLSHQTVSNFAFVPYPPLSVGISGGANVVLTWPGAVDGFAVQSATNLAQTVWTTESLTSSKVNGLNQILLPATNSVLFYRLILPPSP